jgi:thermitase
LDLDVAHGISTGLGTSVAVVDTGVDYNNQTLNPAGSHRVIKGPNTITNVADPIDNLGHGTHVAGIVAATAPNAVIYAVKVIDKDKSGNIVGPVVSSAWGIKAAADAGANVINMSYSGPSKSCWENLAIQYAWLKGCVLVAAAGNDASSARLRVWILASSSI